MYLKLDEKLYKKISNITLTEYGNVCGFIPSENIESMLDDLLLELERVNEKLTDLENDLENNYRPLTNKEIYGDMDII